MEPLKELFLKLGLDADASSFASAQVAVDALEHAGHALVHAFESVGEALLGVVEGTAHQAHEFELLSQKTGESVEKIQEWDSIAKKSGTTVDAMAHAMGILGRNMLAASKGGKEQVEGFHDMGISMAEIKDKSPDEVLRIIADRFDAMEPGFGRNAKLMKVMGRGAAEMIPALIGGSKRLNSIAESAHIFGKVMDEETIAAGVDLYQTMQSISGIVPALTKVLAGPLLKPLAEIAHAFLDWAKANAAVIRTRIQTFALVLAGAIRTLAHWIPRLSKAVEVLVASLKLLAMVVGSFLIAKFVLFNALLLEQVVFFALNSAAAIAYGAVMVWTALKAAAAWLVASAPLLLVTGLLVLAALAAEDLYVFLKGGDSVIGELGPKWTRFLGEFTAVDSEDPWWLVALKAGLQVMLDLNGAWKEFEKEFPKLAAVLKYSSGFGFQEDAQATKDAAVMEAQRFKTITLARGGQAHDIAPDVGAGSSMVGDAQSLASAAFGNGASPSRSLAASPAAGKGPVVLAPKLHAPITVHGAPGQSAPEIAGAVREQLDDFWDSKMREAHDAEPGEEGDF